MRNVVGDLPRTPDGPCHVEANPLLELTKRVVGPDVRVRYLTTFVMKPIQEDLVVLQELLKSGKSRQSLTGLTR
jgi:hypothetical protein